MDRPRFFLPIINPGWCELPPDQAHHARHVLRLKAGDPVLVFDGRGHWASGTLAMELSGTVRVQCQSLQESSRPTTALTLATAVPKLDRADFLVEAASQLNVTAIQWLDCRRSVVRPEPQGKKIEKWRRLAVESAKQCGRGHLLRIEALQSPDHVLKAVVDEWVLWADPQATVTLAQAWRDRREQGGGGTPENPLRVTAFVGPEGGWTDDEITMFRAAGALGVQLGVNILRIEIAALAVAALLVLSRSRNVTLLAEIEMSP